MALKRLIHRGDEKALQRFTREIQVLGKFDHPNVVKVFTSGADCDEYFYAMELIEGVSNSSTSRPFGFVFPSSCIVRNERAIKTKRGCP